MEEDVNMPPKPPSPEPACSAPCSWNTNLAVPPPADVSLQGQAASTHKHGNPLGDHLVTCITFGQARSKLTCGFHDDHRHLPPVGLSHLKNSIVEFGGCHRCYAERSHSGTARQGRLIWNRSIIAPLPEVRSLGPAFMWNRCVQVEGHIPPRLFTNPRGARRNERPNDARETASSHLV